MPHHDYHSEKMKSCIQHLLDDGKDEGSAHAICYASLGDEANIAGGGVGEIMDAVASAVAAVDPAAHPGARLSAITFTRPPDCPDCAAAHRVIVAGGEWDESKHPRDHGKFAPSGGGSNDASSDGGRTQESINKAFDAYKADQARRGNTEGAKFGKWQAVYDIGRQWEALTTEMSKPGLSKEASDVLIKKADELHKAEAKARKEAEAEGPWWGKVITIKDPFKGTIAAVIKKEGDEFVLYTHDGSKILGRHPTRAAAEAQEAAIKNHEHVAGDEVAAAGDGETPSAEALMKRHAAGNHYGHAVDDCPACSKTMNAAASPPPAYNSLTSGERRSAADHAVGAHSGPGGDRASCPCCRVGISPEDAMNYVQAEARARTTVGDAR